MTPPGGEGDDELPESRRPGRRLDAAARAGPRRDGGRLAAAEAFGLLTLADIELAAGQPERARALAAQALEKVGANGPAPLRAQVRRTLADAEELTGDPAAASTALTHALDLTDRFRLGPVTPERRAAERLRAAIERTAGGSPPSPGSS